MQWWIYWPAVPAFALAVGIAAAGRALRLPWITALAAGAGLLAGWWWTFGLPTASPRQLPERLPLLALLLLGMVAIGGLGPRLRWPAVGFGTVLTGWWMAGAPRTAVDLVTALPVLVAIAAGAASALRQDGRWHAALASLALLAGLALAALPGPGLALGVALVGATLGAALAANSTAPSILAALPVAGGMAALAALPLLARGAPADWSAAAAPLAVLWLATPIARLLPPGRFQLPAAAALAALPFVCLSWLVD